MLWSLGMVKLILSSNRDKKILAHFAVIFTSILKPAEKIADSPKPELVVYSDQKLIWWLQAAVMLYLKHLVLELRMFSSQTVWVCRQYWKTQGITSKSSSKVVLKQMGVQSVFHAFWADFHTLHAHSD